MMEILSGSSESSTVEQVPRHNDQMVGNKFDEEFEGCDESSELELGLGLSLGVTKSVNPRILIAKDHLGGGCSTNSGVTVTTNSNKTNLVSGTKRAASPTAVSQVVGWPPIRSYRMASMANQAKSIAIGEHNSEFDETKVKDVVYGGKDNNKGNNVNSKDRAPHKSSLFVKVNMDGVAIGRKVDLTAHSSYESLAQALEEMFNNRVEKSNAEELILIPKVVRSSKLLDGKSDMVLTYEDKDGDWMLVGDVPWRMLVTSVKRLKIMRTSEASGLAPRSEDRSMKQKSRPIVPSHRHSIPTEIRRR